MSKKFIIVKYAEINFPSGKAPMFESVYGTYSAKECGVKKKHYSSRDEANSDLEKLRDFNPMVGYGIVEGLKPGDYENSS